MIHKTQTLRISNADSENTRKSSYMNDHRGLFLAFLSGLFYSSIAVIVKRMTNLSPGHLAVYRFLAIFLFSLPQTMHSQKNVLGPKGSRFLLILRGIFGASTLFLNFVAFRYLPLGEAAVIIFSLPVFVTIFARIFLKEECSFVQSVTVVIAVAGILLTARIPLRLSGHMPAYTNENVYGLLAAFGSLIFNTSRYIVLRKVKDVHHAIIVFNSGWVALIVTIILTLLIGDFKSHFCGLQSWLIILFGLLSYGGQMLLTLALKCEQAGPVSTMRAASDITLAFMWQTFLFHDSPDESSIVGAALVGFSVVFVGFRKWVVSIPEGSRFLRYLKWLKL